MRLAGSRAWSMAGIAAFALCGAIPIAAYAQAPPPSYARPRAATETVHGRIASIQGAYQITVQDDRGYFDVISLRQGTVISPRGLRLEVGMIVTVTGVNGGSTLNADVVDALVADGGSLPADEYYDGGYGNYPDYWIPLYAGGATIVTQPQPHPATTPPPHRRAVEPPQPNVPRRIPLGVPNRPDASGVPEPRSAAPPPPAPMPPPPPPPPAAPPPPPPPRYEPPPQRAEPREPSSPTHH